MRRNKRKREKRAATVTKKRTTTMSKREEELIATDFNIVIDDLAYQKVMYYVDKSSVEVSGFGSARLEGKTFYVDDVILVEQENGAAHTDIDGTALAKAMYQQRDVEGGIKWWWHSHVNMNTFWSGEDKNTIRTLGKHGWILATVFNKSREYRSAFYTTTEVMGNKHEIFVDQLPTSTNREIDGETIKAWDEEYDACVKKPTPRAYNSYLAGSYAPKEYDSDFLAGWEHDPYNIDPYTDKGDVAGQLQEAALTGVSDYDMYGWGGIGPSGDYVYNPVKDLALSVEETIKEINDTEYLNKEDYNFLKQTDNSFRIFVNANRGKITREK